MMIIYLISEFSIIKYPSLVDEELNPRWPCLDWFSPESTISLKRERWTEGRKRKEGMNERMNKQMNEGRKEQTKE